MLKIVILILLIIGGIMKVKYKSLNIKNNFWATMIYIFLRIIVIFLLIDNLINNRYENVLICFLTLILFLLPFIIEEKFNIELPSTLEIIILLFIFSAEILGELNAFYQIIPNWDNILHTINGFVMGAIGFSFVNLLNNSKSVHLKLSPIFVVLMSFCFSMTIGVLWEFGEYGVDKIMKTDMQKDTIINEIYSVKFDNTNSNKVINKKLDNVFINNEEWEGYLDIGLIDTMHDMFVNLLGALTFSLFGYFYLTNNKFRIVENFLIKKRGESHG